MSNNASGRAALMTGGVAAVLASACCLGPLVLVSIGLGGAWVANLTALEPYRPVLIAVALAAPGMNRAACPIAVKKALVKVEGVAKVDVSLDRREAVVTFDDTKAAVGQLTRATTDAGYPSTAKVAR